MTQKEVFIAIDGDNIGRELEKLLALDDLPAVTDFSHKVAVSLEKIGNIIRKSNGRIVFSGGDSVLAIVSQEQSMSLADQAVCINNSLSFSVGIGQKMSTAMLALKMAKASGRGCVVHWHDLIKREEQQ